MSISRLPSNVRIVDDNGLPTMEFLRAFNSMLSRIGGGPENPPSTPTGLGYSIGPGGVTLFCDLNAVAENIIGYQWRLGPTWDGGTVLSPLGPNKILIPSDQVGTYTIWVAASDQRGNFSAPASMVVTVTASNLGMYGPSVTLVSTGLAFVNLKNGGGLTPASLNLTALTLNLPTPTFVWQVDGVVQAGATGAIFTLPSFAAGTSKVVRCDVTSGSLTAFDKFTIYSVNEGDDAITAGLSNENQSILVDSTGTPVSGLPAGGNMTVARGAVILSTGVTYSLVSTTGCTATIGATTGIYSVTAISADTASATFRATVTATNTIVDRVMSLNKSYPGLNAPLLSLTGTGFAFVFTDSSATSSASPTITLTANLQNVTGTATFTATAYDAANTSLGTITLGGTGNSRTLSAAQFVTWGTTTTRYVTVVATLGSLSDTFTIYRGDGGTNAVAGLLTNEAQTVPASNSGVVSSFVGAGGTFKVYQGLTDVTTSAAFSVLTNTDGVTTSIGAATGVYSVTAAGTWGNASNVTTVTYRATYNGVNIDKVFTVTKSLIGATGSPGPTGNRGSLKGYGSQYGISSTSWSDGIANQVISNMLNGTSLTTPLVSTALNVLGDTVQLTNNSNFVQSKFWSGSAWIASGTVVEGNVLVNGTGVFTGDLNIGGTAQFGGATTAAGFTWAAVFNTTAGSNGGVIASTATNYAIKGYGTANGGVGVWGDSTGLSSNGVVGTADTGRGVYGQAIQSGGIGVHGQSTNAGGYGVKAENTGGGAALQVLGPVTINNSTLTWNSKNYTAPAADPNKVFGANGNWLDLNKAIQYIAVGSTATNGTITLGQAVGYLTLNTLDGSGQINIPYYNV